jgi:hypothetical protein
MEDDALAGDPLGERRPNLAGGHEVDVALEQRLRVGGESGALAQAESMARERLDEEVKVGIRPKVGPGGRAERDHAPESVAPGQGTQPPIAGDRDAIVEAPQEWSVLVAMPGPVGERPVHGSRQDAHLEGAVTGRPVVEQAAAQGGLVEQLDAERRVEGADVGKGALQERLVSRLGVASDHKDGALLVGPGELDGPVGAGHDGQRLNRLDHRQRE